jgi:ribonuclease BN (tRNA processing enzyme)
VAAGGTSILLDAGPGTFAELQRHIDPGRIDAVVLTHAHPDHWTDLESLATWAGYGPGRQCFRGEGPGHDPSHDRVLRIYAPPGLRERSSYAPAAWLEWREVVAPTRLTIGSADSGPRWTVAEFGPSVDVFLCEAAYTQEHEGSLLHLSGREAGEMARAAGVGRLILTHRWPTVSANDVRREAELAFGLPVEQASMGAVFGW